MNAQETALQIYKELFTADGKRLKRALEKRSKGETLTREEVRLIIDAAMERACSTHGMRETRSAFSLSEVLAEVQKLVEEGQAE